MRSTITSTLILAWGSVGWQSVHLAGSPTAYHFECLDLLSRHTRRQQISSLGLYASSVSELLEESYGFSSGNPNYIFPDLRCHHPDAQLGLLRYCDADLYVGNEWGEAANNNRQLRSVDRWSETVVQQMPNAKGQSTCQMTSGTSASDAEKWELNCRIVPIAVIGGKREKRGPPLPEISCNN